MDVREKSSGHPHRHPWEIARADSVFRVLRPLFPLGDAADVGAGDLYVAGRLRAHVRGTMYAVESEADQVAPLPGVHLSHDVLELEERSVDLMLLLDVLEHVQDDREFFETCIRRVRPGGSILITVPAYQALFSAHDYFLNHFRRYDRRALRKLLGHPQVEVQEMFYFFSVLLPCRALSVFIEKLSRKTRSQTGASAWPLQESSPITRILVAVLKADFYISRRLSRWGIRWGGLSLCAKCRIRSV